MKKGVKGAEKRLKEGETLELDPKLSLKEKFLLKQYEDRCVLACIRLLTGGKKFLIVKSLPDGSFDYKGKTYVLDVKFREYIWNYGIYGYEFDESFTLPIRVNGKVKKSVCIPVSGPNVEQIREAITESGLLDIEYATNPGLMNSFVSSNIIKNMIQSGGIGEFNRKLLFITIINLLLLAINTFMLGKQFLASTQ